MDLNRIYVPPIKIQGIKTKLVPWIRENLVLNEETVWVEPFMGSGVVGFNVYSNNAIFADTNPHIINFYNQIKKGKITAFKVREFLEYEGKELERFDEKHYYSVRERFNKHHEPLDFLFLNRSCFNGMIRFNKNYQFNVPYGHKPKRFSKAYITKIVNQVSHVEKLINKYNWVFLCQSFEKTIEESPTNSFIYCDPPYIGRHVDYYDSWDESSEINLRDLLINSGQKFMLSTWERNAYRENEYINNVWNSCSKITRNHFYHLGGKEENRRPIVEALLVNYDFNIATNLLNNIDQQIEFEFTYN